LNVRVSWPRLCLRYISLSCTSGNQMRSGQLNRDRSPAPKHHFERRVAEVVWGDYSIILYNIIITIHDCDIVLKTHRWCVYAYRPLTVTRSKVTFDGCAGESLICVCDNLISTSPRTKPHKIVSTFSFFFLNILWLYYYKTF